MTASFRFSLKRSRLALVLALLATPAASSALAGQADAAAPRALQCSEPLVQTLNAAREESAKLKASLPEDISEDLTGAISELASRNWAKASLNEALEAGLLARSFESQIKQTQAQQNQTQAFLLQAREISVRERDKARLTQTEQAERELALARKAGAVYARLASAVKAFSLCAAPRGQR